MALVSDSYFSQMRIRTWYSRAILPGAAISRPIILKKKEHTKSDNVIPETIPDSVPPIQIDPPPPASKYIPSLKESDGIDAPVNWIIVDTERILLISECAEYVEGVRLDHFLQHFLFSLTGSSTPPNKAIHFSWPVFSNKALPGNDCGTMMSLIQNLIAPKLDAKKKIILLLGERVPIVLSEYISGEYLNFAHNKEEKKKNNFSFYRYFSFAISVTEMFDNPSSKRKLWLDLLKSKVFSHDDEQ